MMLSVVLVFVLHAMPYQLESRNQRSDNTPGCFKLLGSGSFVQPGSPEKVVILQQESPLLPTQSEWHGGMGMGTGRCRTPYCMLGTLGDCGHSVDAQPLAATIANAHALKRELGLPIWMHHVQPCRQSEFRLELIFHDEFHVPREAGFAHFALAVRLGPRVSSSINAQSGTGSEGKARVDFCWFLSGWEL